MLSQHCNVTRYRSSQTYFLLTKLPTKRKYRNPPESRTKDFLSMTLGKPMDLFCRTCLIFRGCEHSDFLYRENVRDPPWCFSQLTSRSWPTAWHRWLTWLLPPVASDFRLMLDQSSVMLAASWQYGQHILNIGPSNFAIPSAIQYWANEDKIWLLFTVNYFRRKVGFLL